MSNLNTVYLKDYRQPDYTVKTTKLLFKLGAKKTIVTAEYHVMRLNAKEKVLWLDGEDLKLLSISLDGERLEEGAYEKTSSQLGIFCDQDEALVKIEVEIIPEDNTQLQGLYQSGKSLCTQCESQGFRRIIYSIDRPDVMSTFDVAVIYDVSQYPSVIVAGHLQERRVLNDGYEYIRYIDMTPKPTYLFALVAGYFNTLESSFTTRSGKAVSLYIHLPIHYAISQVEFAMVALKKAMKWDEEKFNCVYDLDVYHIVGFADFNFGAMENKGLNIFNTSRLLADPQVTSDAGYLDVLAVVGHEYFHNWTGNRVGCANWFQLSLKEGLTTYREMRFACDNYGDTARLGYIRSLVEGQFKEDRGPTAHAVIPASYQKIDNFYTSTIYTKGSEVLRMLEDIIGRDKIDLGISRYLQKYDGKSVTIHEFLEVMAEVSGLDLTSFKRWYWQVGTPLVSLKSAYDSEQQTLLLTAEQQAGRQDFQDKYQTVLIPIRCRLWSESGKILRPKNVQGGRVLADGSWVVVLAESRGQFVIEGVSQKPILSSFLGLSAPVEHRDDLTISQRAGLMSYETDAYVKSSSAKECWMSILADSEGSLPHEFIEHLGEIISGWRKSPEMVSWVFNVPSLRVCQESGRPFILGALAKRHRRLFRQIATHWEAVWFEIFSGSKLQLQHDYKWCRQDVEMRKLQALSLKMLLYCNFERYIAYATGLFEQADNVTTRCAVLDAIAPHRNEESARLLDQFYSEIDGHDLLANKWLYYATLRVHDKIEDIELLFNHPICDHKQPNRIMAWLGGWLEGNYELLHDSSGTGYSLLRDVIMRIDGINPYTATKMIGPMLQYRYFCEDSQNKIQAILREMMARDPSKGLKEKLETVV